MCNYINNNQQSKTAFGDYLDRSVLCPAMLNLWKGPARKALYSQMS